MASQSRQLTVKDIARLSGTSPSTVSRVLTGVVPVAEHKRAAVLKVVEELNYRPNLLARSLKTRATLSIGLLINDILNPFYGAIARGVEDYAGEKGYAVIICNTSEDYSKELSYLRMLQDKAVDGVILAPTGANAEAMAGLQGAGIGLVQIDRYIPALAASRITLDNEHGGYLAARHLLDQGHERIGFVTYAMGQMTVAEREAGYRRAMREAGFEAGRQFVAAIEFDLKNAGASNKALLAPSGASRPTALIAANNRIALAVLRTARELKASIPDDLALVVFDDLELFDLMTPSLTAVAQPAYEIGRKAAETLLTEIRSGSSSHENHILYQPTLIARGSSPPPRMS